MEQIDLTRLSRHERRAYQTQNGTKIPGRNMPFIKKLHGTVADFNKKRAEEIEEDKKQLIDGKSN